MKKEPHLITNYVYDLAAMFHNYYGKHKILTDDMNISSQQDVIFHTLYFDLRLL